VRAVIDTNVLIYDCVEDSIYHSEASDILDSLKFWYIPIIVLFEFVWFFRAEGLSIHEIYDLIIQYLEDPRCRVISIRTDIFVEALSIIRDEKLSLARINDKTIVLTAKNLKIPIATFDEKLRKQASKIGIEVLPKKIKKI